MQTNIVKAPTSSGGTTYGVGSNGQVLKSNGTSVYWGPDNDTTSFVASSQGTGNSGKFLTVNSSGQVVCSNFSDMVTNRSSSDLTVSGATVTAPAGYYAAAASKAIGNGTVVASVSSNSGGSASMAATGFTAAGSATSYYVTLSTSAGSVKAKATGGTAGYVTSSTTNETAATSVSVSGNGNKLYIPTTGVTASVSSNTGGSASMAATGFTAASSATSYYVTLSTSAGSVKAKAVGNGTGIVTSSTTNETAATSVAVSGNGNKLYVPTTGVTASVSSNTGGSASMAATGFTAASSATDYYVTLSTSAGSVKAKAVGNGTGIVTSSTTNETGATSASVSGNGTKLYVPAGGITNNTTLPSGVSSSGTINRGSYIKISAGYHGSDKYYLAQNVSNGTITNNTTLPSGSSSSGTINRGSYIKIGAGYYANNAYYLAQSNSGTLTLDENYFSKTNISCDGYANVNISAIAVPKDTTFTLVTQADTELDTTSDVTVMNNARRQVYVDNRYTTSNLKVNNKGVVVVESASVYDGVVTIKAKNSSSVLEEKTIITDGVWVETNVSAAGTYWGRVTVNTGTIINNTSGGTSSGTINRGSQIKIGKGYYAADTYYTAQSNSGTLTVDTSKSAKTNISCNGYANVKVTGITLPKSQSFAIKVYTDASNQVTFTFTTDANGNTTVT
jgi:hypothetical protein